MLLSSLSLMTYAADIIIDLGPLFDDSDDSSTDDTSTDNSSTGNKDQSSNKGNGTGAGTTTKSDENTDDTQDTEDNSQEVVVDSAWEDNPYTDVKAGDWYYEAVKYAVQNQLFNGLSADTFGPNNPLTRGMLVTVLYRAEGSPEVSSDSQFSDVAEDAWFGKAVIWASENGVVNGYDDGTFLPNANITREQIATIIYRFASYKGLDVSKGDTTNIVSFYSDSMSVSDYAKKALQYTVGEGIMMGKTEKTLNPKDNATRAEAATVLNRFLSNI